MSKWLFRLAALACLGGVAAHELVGAPMVLPPLSEAGLPPEIIGLHRFSWHVGSVAVIAMAYLYGYASWRPGNAVMAAVATVMSFGFAALGIGLSIGSSEPLWGTPAPYVWTLVGILGAFGLLAARRGGEHE